MNLSFTDIDAYNPADLHRAAAIMTAIAAALAANPAGMPRPAAAPMPPAAADFAAAAAQLDPADNPAAGVDIQTAPEAFGANPVEAFGNTAGGPAVSYTGAALDPAAAAAAAAFGNMGNGVVSPSASFPNPASGHAGLLPTSTQTAQAAAAFTAPGEAGNAGAGSPVISGQVIASLPPAAPSAPANTGATAPAGVELDSRGLPWDGRIHAGTKSKKANGEWTAKRGVESPLVAQVEAELRGVLAVPSPSAPPAPPAPPAAGNVAVSPGLPPAPPAPPAPITAPTAPATIPTAPAGAVNPPAAPTFVSVMTRVGELTSSGKLTEAEANSAVLAVGLQSFPQLVNRPDLVPSVSATLESILASKG